MITLYERIERLLGKSKTDSHTVTYALIEDVRSATYYPPPNVPKPESSEVVAAIDTIVADLQSQQEEAEV